MSVHVSSWVWKHAPRLDPTAMLVLLALADQANDDGESWYSAASIGKRCRISERQVRTWLDRLENAGVISVKERRGKSSIITVLCGEAAPTGPVDNPTEPRKRPAGVKSSAGVRATAGHPGSPPQGCPEVLRSRTIKNQQEPQQHAAAAINWQPLDTLIAACQVAHLGARFDRLTVDERAEIGRLIDLHGIRALVKSAQAQHRPDNPALFAKAWIPGWQALAVKRSPATAERCSTHEHEQLPCRACTADHLAGFGATFDAPTAVSA